MANHNVGIVDSPIRGSKRDDNLEFSTHARALAEFISKSETPITIGIQGEWGSGKTSLMNTVIKILDESFDKDADTVNPNSRYHHIWINAWEHSIMQEPQNALFNIVQDIIDKILEADKAGKAKRAFKTGVTKGSKDLFRIVSSYFNAKAGQVAEEWLESTNSIKRLRDRLSSASEEIRNDPKNPVEKIIVYVDDLDRIEPRNAVQILELLKNIFNVRGCLFVLAIDYQVVVKGLEAKFGKQTDRNEWEFRAYFDKIIQLPFMMPIATYEITKYLGELLKQTGFIKDELDSKFVKNVVYNTIGSNPRALKRLVNSLTLIKLFGNHQQAGLPKNGNPEDLDKGSQDVEQLILASLVCIQISFPKIFELIQERPNFYDWDEDFVFTKTSQIEQDLEKFEEDFSIASNSEDFDEEWEQALYRYCYYFPRLRNNATEISKALNYIKNSFETYLNQDKSKKEFHSEMIRILNRTSVTSVSDTSTSESRVRKLDSDHFTYYEGFKDWVDQVNENSDVKIPENVYRILNDLHDHVKTKYNLSEAELDYSKTGGASFSIDSSKGSKFFQIGPVLQKSKQFVELLVARDYQNNYQKPGSSAFEIENIRKYPFNKKKPVPWGYQFFIVKIYDEENYRQNKDMILRWIDSAYQTCANDKKLSIRKNDNHEILDKIFYPEKYN